MGCELAWYLTHPQGRHDRAAAGEHPEGEAEHAGAGSQLAVQRYAAVERPEERVYVSLRETGRLQVLERRCISTAVSFASANAHGRSSRHQIKRAELVPERGRIGEE